jgi:hypothetical protein
MLMRFDGAAAPNTDEGTIEGNPATTEVATMLLPAAARKSRRDVDFGRFRIMPESL